MNQHVMEMGSVHATGAQEWYCPTCGRRYLLQLQPSYKKIVLEVGDENVVHSGSNFGMVVGGVSANPQPEDNAPLAAPEIEENLGGDSQVELNSTLRKWLKDAGLDSLI